MKYYVEYTIIHNYDIIGAEPDKVSCCGYAPLSRTAKQIVERIASQLDNDDEIVELHITRE